MAEGSRPTLQNLGLRNVRLACALQGSSVHEIKHYAVGKFLTILVRWVWGAEVAKVEALDDALLVMLRGAEDKVA